MREVSVFYAYDDTEFYDRDECFAYEEKALNCLRAIDKCYVFFDKDMNVLFAPIDNDIDNWFWWVSESAEQCCYIKRHRELPDEVNKFVHREVGYCIENEDFEDGLGLFKYDTDQCEWVKVE